MHKINHEELDETERGILEHLRNIDSTLRAMRQELGGPEFDASASQEQQELKSEIIALLHTAQRTASMIHSEYRDVADHDGETIYNNAGQMASFIFQVISSLENPYFVGEMLVDDNMLRGPIGNITRITSDEHAATVATIQAMDQDLYGDEGVIHMLQRFKVLQYRDIGDALLTHAKVMQRKIDAVENNLQPGVADHNLVQQAIGEARNIFEVFSEKAAELLDGQASATEALRLMQQHDSEFRRLVWSHTMLQDLEVLGAQEEARLNQLAENERRNNPG